MEFSLSVYDLPLDGNLFQAEKNLNIPATFPLPSCSPWPTCRQQKLGSQVQHIRTGSMFLSEEEKDVLESMDFKWGPKGRTPQRENKRQRAN